MGSFSYFSINEYPIFEEKNGYIPQIPKRIFLPADYIEEVRPYASRNKLFWGDAYKNEIGNFTFKGFKQKVGVCKQRLEIFGNSYKSSKIDFKIARKIAHEEGSLYDDIKINKVTYEEYLKEDSR